PSNMKPGGAMQTGTVDIANKGSLAGAFTLTRDQLASTDTGVSNPSAFATKVNLKVVDCGKFGDGSTPPPACGDGDDTELYAGTLAAMQNTVVLGDFAAGEKHRYQF